MRKIFSSHLWLLTVLLFAQLEARRCCAQSNTVGEINVQQTYWGFDGKARPEQFQPLSVKLQNTTDAPWAGTLQLERLNHSLQPIDVTITLPVRLQAAESRWFQLVPFVGGQVSQWRLRWGEGSHQSQILEATFGTTPVCARIVNDDSLDSAGPNRPLPSACFPDTVVALDSLAFVLLDRVPEFNDSQAQALLDWIQLGGRLAICHDSSGNYPTFSEKLSPLQQNASQFLLRRGSVIKFPKRKEEVTDFQIQTRFDEITQKRNAPPTWQQRLEHHTPDPIGYGNRILSELHDMVQFTRNWPLIWGAVAAYFTALVTYCYRLGYHKQNVRGFYVAFIGTVAGFSLIFWLLGELGASARNQTASALIAQEISPGRWNVKQWSQFASVNRGTSEFRFPGEAVWSTTDYASVGSDGMMESGPNAIGSLKFLPASTQRLMQRKFIEAPGLSPIVLQAILSDNELQAISISIDSLPNVIPLAAKAIYEDRILDLAPGNSPQTLSSRSAPTSLSDYIHGTQKWWRFRWHLAPPDPPPSEKKQQHWEPLSRNLVAASLLRAEGWNDWRLWERRQTVRIAILTTLPESLQLKSDENWRESGFVLWTYDVPLGGTVPSR